MNLGLVCVEFPPLSNESRFIEIGGDLSEWRLMKQPTVEKSFHPSLSIYLYPPIRTPVNEPWTMRQETGEDSARDNGVLCFTKESKASVPELIPLIPGFMNQLFDELN